MTHVWVLWSKAAGACLALAACTPRDGVEGDPCPKKLRHQFKVPYGRGLCVVKGDEVKGYACFVPWQGGKHVDNFWLAFLHIKSWEAVLKRFSCLTKTTGQSLPRTCATSASPPAASAKVHIQADAKWIAFCSSPFGAGVAARPHVGACVCDVP